MTVIRLRFREDGITRRRILIRDTTACEKIALLFRGYRPHETMGGWVMMKKGEAVTMNTYEIEGIQYKATNEYDAVKQAYKMAQRIEWVKYCGNNVWQYRAIFRSGAATVTVGKIDGGDIMTVDERRLQATTKTMISALASPKGNK